MQSRPYHIFITLIIQSCRIWYWPIHDPSMRLVLCPDEVFNLPGSCSAPDRLIIFRSLRYSRFRRHMTRSQFCLPISMHRKLRAQIRPRHRIAHLFALAFPQRSTLCNCSSVQASRSTDLTRLMCVPIPRCIPEQLWPIISACAVVPVQVQQYTGCRQISPSSNLPIVDLFLIQPSALEHNKAHSSLKGAHALVPFAVCTALVSFQLQQALDCLLVLGGTLRCRVRSSSGHDELQTRIS